MDKKVRLSQCMIVKNEERHIEQALSWGKDVVCEQIVVDTGSTDRTVEIAEKMGAKVFHFEWIEDFSAAKNYAIEQAAGNWIAFLDADEYYQEEDVEKLMIILDGLENLCDEEIRPHLIRSSLICLDDAGKPMASFSQDRIFQNQIGIKYHRKIHETLTFPKESGKSLVYYSAEDELTILHSGYAASVYMEAGKAERNLKLLRRDMEEEPDNYETMMYLGESLSNAGYMEESDELFHKIVNYGLEGLKEHYRNLSFYHLMKNIFTRNVQEEEDALRDLYNQAYSWDQSYPDINYVMGLWFVKRGKWEEVTFYMERGLVGLESYMGLTPLYMSANLQIVYRALSTAAWMAKDKVSTVKYGILCLRLDKYTGEILQRLLFLLKDDPSEDQYASGTYRIMSGLYDFKLLKDILLIHRCAQIAKFSELADRMESLLSEDEKEVLKQGSKEKPTEEDFMHTEININ